MKRPFKLGFLGLFVCLLLVGQMAKAVSQNDKYFVGIGFDLHSCSGLTGAEYQRCQKVQAFNREVAKKIEKLFEQIFKIEEFVILNPKGYTLKYYDRMMRGYALPSEPRVCQENNSEENSALETSLPIMCQNLDFLFTLDVKKIGKSGSSGTRMKSGGSGTNTSHVSGEEEYEIKMSLKKIIPEENAATNNNKFLPSIIATSTFTVPLIIDYPFSETDEDVEMAATKFIHSFHNKSYQTFKSKSIFLECLRPVSKTKSIPKGFNKLKTALILATVNIPGKKKSEEIFHNLFIVENIQDHEGGEINGYLIFGLEDISQWEKICKEQKPDWTEIPPRIEMLKEYAHYTVRGDFEVTPDEQSSEGFYVYASIKITPGPGPGIVMREIQIHFKTSPEKIKQEDILKVANCLKEKWFGSTEDILCEY